MAFTDSVSPAISTAAAIAWTAVASTVAPTAAIASATTAWSAMAARASTVG